MRVKRVLSLAISAAAVAAGTIAIAPSAQAAGSGNCQLYDACYYYNSNQSGAFYGFSRATAITTERFGGGGNGQGKLVKDDAAYVLNRNGFTLRVDYNSSNRCAYACQHIPAWTGTNLNSTLKNNNAAHLWVGNWSD